MKKRTYTDNMVDFLSANADQYTLAELTKIFNEKFKCNKTLSAIENFVYQNKLRSPSFIFTEEMVDFLRASPDYISSKELTNRFNSNFNLSKEPYHIRNCCLKNGIKKSKVISDEMIDFLRANFEDISHEELTMRFNSKFNLNKKKYDIAVYCSKYGFKKSDPHALPVGSERLRATSGGIYVKVADGEWKAKHRLIWEQHNGPIPKGHYVIFADRNMENCNIENLELVTADELFYLSHSSLFHADEELTRIGINIAKISVKIRKYNKKKEKMQLVKKRRTRPKFDEYIYTGKSKL